MSGWFIVLIYILSNIALGTLFVLIPIVIGKHRKTYYLQPMDHNIVLPITAVRVFIEELVNDADIDVLPFIILIIIIILLFIPIAIIFILIETSKKFALSKEERAQVATGALRQKGQKGK